MLNQKNFPKVYIYDGAIYSDVSAYALNFGRDHLEATLETTDFLYFGRVKPFDAFYIEMGHQTNNVVSTLAVEYYNGTAWVPVGNLFDDTRCFNRSGFVQFDKPANWAQVLVGVHTQYFVRMSPSVNTRNNMHIQGINIVFSDDQDLNGVYPGLTNYRDASELSFVLRHENSRNLIVQDIRNRGMRKIPTGSFSYENYDEWDFLKIAECRQWSTYLTLANIFGSLQSKEDGLYRQKYEEYTELADLYKTSFYLTLDKNDNGTVDIAEKAMDISTRRLVRG